MGAVPCSVYDDVTGRGYHHHHHHAAERSTSQFNGDAVHCGSFDATYSRRQTFLTQPPQWKHCRRLTQLRTVHSPASPAGTRYVVEPELWPQEDYPPVLLINREGQYVIIAVLSVSILEYA
ncbi:hypothetical protein HPB52_017542 [Rhipicephalus sanguineus]|uniref:Uncharacterized protein n=1 Tax=Rhipicephalus sanguineus TaxID=34632 RepID=A0A9D4Q9Y2_RHISA|nr:hypothetical protein HPB52_017542 [Rhipicephalus sanguineus]